MDRHWVEALKAPHQAKAPPGVQAYAEVACVPDQVLLSNLTSVTALAAARLWYATLTQAS